MKRSLILLRGINVSGHNKVPMADLRAALTDAGLVNVATYIQSGNIAVDSDADAKDLGQLVEQMVLESFDVRVPAVVIAQSEIQSILNNAPFSTDADAAYQVIYFSGAPVDTAGVAAIDGSKYPGDDITATEKVIYVSYENGQSKSKLTINTLERAAGCNLTGRNLRSTVKLLSL